MNTKIILSLAVVAILAVYHAEALKCYQCTSEVPGSNYESEDACKDEDPDTGKMNQVVVPDEDECYLCAKYVISDVVTRVCISKDTWDDTEDTYDFSDEDSCEEDGDNLVCVCGKDKCNSGNSVIASLVSILMAVTAKLLL